MLLQLKAKHFTGTKYASSKEGCAIEKALREVLPGKRVSSGVMNIYVEGETFLIENNGLEYDSYSHYDFKKDQENASCMEPEEIVRTISIPGLENLNLNLTSCV